MENPDVVPKRDEITQEKDVRRLGRKLRCKLKRYLKKTFGPELLGAIMALSNILLTGLMIFGVGWLWILLLSWFASVGGPVLVVVGALLTFGIVLSFTIKIVMTLGLVLDFISESGFRDQDPADPPGLLRQVATLRKTIRAGASAPALSSITWLRKGKDFPAR